MSLIPQLREHFAAHPDTRFNNRTLRDALDTDDSKSISNGLFALMAADEIKHEKVEGHGTQYWLPSSGNKSPPPPMAHDEAVRVVKRRSAAAPVPKPAKKSPPGKRGRKKAAPVNEVKAARIPAKRKYTRRAAPQPQPAPLAPRAAEPTDVVFAIRNDGELGIDKHGNAVSLSRADVKRLKDFLQTVAPLWS
ncbi:MAG TPA: hypothetical protein VJT81_06755 [Burkholderiales bacterium]|nr:hypothetical protein [Burkholderiales bacterium]